MRVIAGTCRGRKLLTPAGVVTRPTSDRVKESLFSILTSRIDFSQMRVLDICAGTGSLGIEAISRGAEFCCFIENNRSVVPILDKNLLITGCVSRAEVLTMDAVAALKRCAERGRQFDLAFFDPPYASDLYLTVPAALISARILASAALFVMECSVRYHLPETYEPLQRIDRREYGDTAIELYTLEGK